MPPFLGSLSGDRERRAMTASRDDGKGTSKELQRGQGRICHSKAVISSHGLAVVTVFFFYLVYSVSIATQEIVLLTEW